MAIKELFDCFTAGDGCWDWTAGKSGGGLSGGGGYGTFRGRGAHRVVYEELVGPIPEGLDLDHLCRNRGCVRPKHLEPVTRSENLIRGEDSRTHCVNGHELTEDNIYRHKSHGRRRCKTCTQAQNRRWSQSQ